MVDLPTMPGPRATFNTGRTWPRRRFVGASLLAATFVVAACRGVTPSASPATVTVAPLDPTQLPPPASSPTPTRFTASTGSLTSSTTTPIATAMVASTTTRAVISLPPTNANVDPEDATLPLTEGPYFKANSPEQGSLQRTGVVGTKLALSGQVLSTHGKPIARALLDFWQADGSGNYDNAGYTLRGHQFADAEGRYRLATVVPGLYPGRTRHIHVKVQAPNQPILTTQLFFPNEPLNRSDSIFDPKLVIAEQDAPDGSKVGQFNFVLNVG